jgi:hypothetical protein
MHNFVASSPSALAPNFHNVINSRTLAYFCATERHRADRQRCRACHRSDPPQPIASASAPAHRGRARSSIVAVSRRHFRRTSFSASTANVDHVGVIASIPNRPHSIDLFKRAP